MGNCTSKDTHSPSHRSSPKRRMSFCDMEHVLIMERFKEHKKKSTFDEYKEEGVEINHKAGGYYVRYGENLQKWFIFNLHCDEIAEFIALIKSKTETMEYGNGSKCISGCYSVDRATTFLWRCQKCRIGFSTHPNQEE